MKLLYSIWFFMFGGCFASFCNCIAYRLPRHMNWISGRSICVNCGRELSLLELIPILSCLFLKARCRYCKASFGWSNFFSEAALGIVCDALYLKFDISRKTLQYVVIVVILYLFVAFTISKFKYKKERYI